MITDTIVAIATAMAPGAVAIVRLSGPQCFSIVQTISSIDLANAKGYTIHHGYIMEHEQPVDEVLFSIFRSPHSYTGEDVIEINCHGGMYIARKILSLLLGAGARLALRGEFTQRAFLNGKMDLSQAESVNDLIRATDEVNANSAMRALRGSVKRILAPLLEDLTQIIAQIEVNIDYPEYDDVHQLVQEELLPKVKTWNENLHRLIQTAQKAMLVRDGIDTVIIGRPNVGKSSLLNALLEEDKAIVTDIAGTTRDLVEGDIRIGDLTLHLIDTAGIHTADNQVEAIGMEKTRAVLKKAQLVLLVLDGHEELREEDRQLLEETKSYNRIIVYNKKDLKETPNTLSISAAQGDLSALIQAIEEKYAEGLLSAKSDTFNNERQIALAMQAYHAMEEVQHSLEDGASVDLVTMDLQEAWEALKQINGEAGRENLLDEIFSRFCLGK